MTTENAPIEEASAPETQTTVQTVGDPASPTGLWHLVTCGGWQISVAPDGLIMLPRHLAPAEVNEFSAAAAEAARVGQQVIDDNIERAKNDDRRLPPARAIVTDGPPPPGAVRMLAQAGPNQPSQAATIGRPGRRVAPPGARV